MMMIIKMKIMHFFNLLKRDDPDGVHLSWERIHVDPVLFGLILFLTAFGVAILYSASNQKLSLVTHQLLHLAISYTILFVCAQIPPRYYSRWAPWLFFLSITMLVAVLFIGHVGKGAQRWLQLGFFRFQPSDLVKLTIPLGIAWFLKNKMLPPSKLNILAVLILIAIPALLTLKQPDLGTAIVIVGAGFCVLMLAGMSYWLLMGIILLISLAAPFLWHFIRPYQRQRILTFLDPENDPLGAGYHIIQSKIAIGSGGLFGKGWLQGTQSHLHFLPEHTTDFIFAVWGEEFGFIGCMILLTIYAAIVFRCLYISLQAQDTFSRLLAGGISLVFFLSFFINIGMVNGILPVVGLPLPLISYGGTSMMITMVAFGIMMSIHTHRKLLPS